ncbi:MAG: PEP-CTERM sorting domain-containing protein [Kiritimatiellae bacterium]|nr:PEP-CTERM sorting domain-containing protein [Kiritimatiellia bacterium]
MKIAKIVVLATLALALIVPGASASLVVQELFDGCVLDTTINGVGDLTTSQGLSGTWATNGSTGIWTANNFDVETTPALPGLSPNAGSIGGAYFGSWSVGNNWGTGIYATRALSTAIDFNSDQTLYFSFRLNNGGDSAQGVGLAAGANGSAEFLGAGKIWNGATGLDSGDAANSAYLTYGALDQNLAGNNDGPYAIQQHTAAGSFDGRHLFVGRLGLSSAGNDQFDLKVYSAGDTIESDPDTVAWTLQGSIDSSMSATHLLLWANGSGQSEVDAIRVGTTWMDVTGIPEPATVSLLAAAGLAAVIRRRRVG